MGTYEMQAKYSHEFCSLKFDKGDWVTIEYGVSTSDGSVCMDAPFHITSTGKIVSSYVVEMGGSEWGLPVSILDRKSLRKKVLSPIITMNTLDKLISEHDMTPQLEKRIIKKAKELKDEISKLETSIQHYQKDLESAKDLYELINQAYERKDVNELEKLIA